MKAAILMVLLCLAMGSAHADMTYGTSAPLTGSTTLSGFGNWENPTLSWNIVQSGGGWSYTYTFNHDGADLSHLVLETTLGCGNDPACITNSANNANIGWWEALTPPNFEMPVDIYGVKFDGFSAGSPNVFSFTSDRDPVWGDIFLRDGRNAYAYNAGLLDHSSSLTNDFVARPDGGVAPVPEPTSILLFGSTLLLVSLRLRKSRA